MGRIFGTVRGDTKRGPQKSAYWGALQFERFVRRYYGGEV